MRSSPPLHGKEQRAQYLAANRQETQLAGHQEDLPLARQRVPSEEYVPDVQALEEHVVREADVRYRLVGRGRPELDVLRQYRKLDLERARRGGGHLEAYVLHVPLDGDRHAVGRRGEAVELGQVRPERREVRPRRQQDEDAGA
ncbi:hypothetical protein THAOC_31109 [Thalassiosira oceanica]|uniref:Uncharacterized protein n=1 Tax=Thalassiosira oceanica TaxID=159749 RepID=K0RCF0_THAOC|nr:hypothetical protein THAOC_31109 [Thalassiosira oceanica]|eukprot:EJK49964.1 hypothetical protein THAOC_31109 [Thalassiosira oceanica]